MIKIAAAQIARLASAWIRERSVSLKPAAEPLLPGRKIVDRDRGIAVRSERFGEPRRVRREAIASALSENPVRDRFLTREQARDGGLCWRCWGEEILKKRTARA